MGEKAPKLVLAGGKGWLNDGIYAVFDSVRVSERIEVLGESELYLANGGTLTADEGISVLNGESLSIYGNGGKLYAGTRNGTTFLANDNDAGIGSTAGERAGEIIINSGIVYANGGRNAAGIGGNAASVQILGGTVDAKGGRYGAGIGSGYSDNGSSVDIMGGNVTAAGGTSAAGIGSGYGAKTSTVRLSYNNTADSIYATSYSGNIRFLKTMYTSDGKTATANNIAGVKITPSVAAFTVTFQTNGAGYVAPITVTAGRAISAMPSLQYPGYTLEGWYTDQYFKYRFNERSAINSNITLYARWVKNSYTVSFETNGGNYIQPITVQADSLITGQIPTPRRSGYLFDGWYTDRNFRYYFNYNTTKITGNTTLYAKWQAYGYTVSFETNGGGYIEPMTVEVNSIIGIQMPIPTKAGYRFDAWYTDRNFRYYFDYNNTKVTSDMTL